MIPGSVIALLIFAAVLGPGYVWVRVAERRVPRSVRTPLLEAAELVFLGGTFSAVAFSIVFLAAREFELLVPQQIVDHGHNYILLYPYPAIGVVLCSLALAYVFSYVTARVAHWGFEATIENRYSPWHLALRDKPEERDVYATVDLRDGTTVAGWITGYTVGEVPYSERELVLAAGRNVALRTRPRGESEFEDMLDRTLIIPGTEIATVGLQYFEQLEPAKS